MLFEMVVHGLTLDPLTNMPIIILKDLQNERALPIWIGVFEANAILLELEKVDTPRPMTHDLLKNTIEGMHGTIERIVVTDIKDSTYFASIDIIIDKSHISVDSRPSDAIALALRAKAPIFVTDKVIAASKTIERPESDVEFKEWLDNLKPEDFEK